MYDFHTHSHFSSDSKASMQEMAQACKNIGLKGMCFTEHIDLDYPSSEISFEFSYSEYINELESTKALFSRDFEIFAGLELGMQPHLAEQNKALLEGRRYDFIIGSIHCVKRKDMYDGSFLEGITPNKAVMNYFDDMLQCIDNFSEFDVIGHLDAIRRYLKGSEKIFSYDAYKEFIHDILTKLINSGKGIEVNTSALRYGLSAIHPLPEILKLYKSLGGEIVTIGSDSHSPGTLGYGFRSAMTMLSDYGFKYYTIFKDRKPVFIKL